MATEEMKKQMDTEKEEERKAEEQREVQEMENRQTRQEQEEPQIQDHQDQDEERRQRRKQRIEEMKREKRRRELLYKYGVPAAAVVCFLLLVFGIGRAVHSSGEKGETAQGASMAQSAASSANSETSPEPDTSAQAVETSPESDASSQVVVTSPEPDASAQAVVTSPEPDTLAQNTGAPAQAAASFIGPMPLATAAPAFVPYSTDATHGFSDKILSGYGILIDVESGEILAQKGATSRISPASMTKILTVLVAAEHVTDLDDTFTMTIDITDYSFVNDCSNVGFEVGEVMTVRDLFYGTILQSGADAAVGLATYVAGSHEVFVDMMNEKLEELGLSDSTHFTNCVGLYDQEHYSTAYDMAVILKAATDNEFCREVLSEHIYTTSATAEHPEGITISNWFLRRIEDRDTHGEVLCAKTGYVVQSKSCAASLATDRAGKEYICVTAGSNSSWTCIADQVELYQRYLDDTPVPEAE